MAIQPAVLMSFSGQDEELLGAFNLKKKLKKAAGFHPAALAYKAALALKKRRARMGGDAFGLTPEESGYYYGAWPKKFLPGLTKIVKKVGKVTSPITTAIAKTFIPAGLVDAAAKLDPTRRGSSPAAAAQAASKALTEMVKTPAAPTDAEMKKDAILKTLTNPKVLAVAGGGIVLLMLMKKRR